MQAKQKPESEKLSKIQDAYNNLKFQIDQPKSKIEMFDSQLKSLYDQKLTCENQLAAINDSCSLKKGERDGYRDQIDQYLSAIANANKDLKNIEQKIAPLEVKLDESKQKYQIMSQHVEITKPSKLLDFLLKQKGMSKIKGEIYGRLVFFFKNFTKSSE